MKKFACMTSMHQPYYDHIGRHMIESWQKYWPADIDLYLYAEKMNFSSDDPRIVVVDWDSACYGGWHEFSKKTDDGNALKFGKKGWASLHGWKNIDAEFIIWLDADLLFSNPINEEVLLKTINKDQLVSLFDTDYQRKEPIRTHWSAESGYVAVNKLHPEFQNFIKRYEEIYRLDKKPDEIVNWWDNETLMLAAKDFLPHIHDLSQYRTTNKTQTPMNHSFLGGYMSHFKGKSKKSRTKEEFVNFTKGNL